MFSFSLDSVPWLNSVCSRDNISNIEYEYRMRICDSQGDRSYNSSKPSGRRKSKCSES